MKRRIEELEEKYFDLVSFARKSDEDIERIPSLKEWMDDMRIKYPKETEELEGEESDWHHGFNSGVLAAVRYVRSPQEEFPFLDT